MSIFLSHELRVSRNKELRDLGAAHVKSAGDAVKTYALSGRLYLSESGWLLLSVPNSLVRGAFDAMHEPGIELPLRNGRLNAHVTIMRPEEIKQLGGPDKVNERGHTFSFNLGPVKTCVPDGWEGVSRVWLIEISSPELQALRRSYGLSALPKDGKHPFHCTIARRAKNVLKANELSKAGAVKEASPEEAREKIQAFLDSSSDDFSGICVYVSDAAVAHRGIVLIDVMDWGEETIAKKIAAVAAKCVGKANVLWQNEGEPPRAGWTQVRRKAEKEAGLPALLTNLFKGRKPAFSTARPAAAATVTSAAAVPQIPVAEEVERRYPQLMTRLRSLPMRPGTEKTAMNDHYANGDHDWYCSKCSEGFDGEDDPVCPGCKKDCISTNRHLSRFLLEKRKASKKASADPSNLGVMALADDAVLLYLARRRAAQQRQAPKPAVPATPVTKPAVLPKVPVPTPAPAEPVKFAATKNHHAPVVRTKVRHSSEDVWICPHCAKEIAEKSLYCDKKGWWFHRPCMSRGSITLPEGRKSAAAPFKPAVSIMTRLSAKAKANPFALTSTTSPTSPAPADAVPAPVMGTEVPHPGHNLQPPKKPELLLRLLDPHSAAAARSEVDRVGIPGLLDPRLKGAGL